MLKRLLRSLIVSPIIILVALYVLLEDFLENVVKPLVTYIAAWHILRMVKGFLQKRNPYTLFVIYAAKLVLFSSIKFFALYLISKGQASGAPLLVGGELCGAMLTVWYANVALPSLLTLRWFATGYGKVTALKNWLTNKLKQMAIYQYIRAKVTWCRCKIRNVGEFAKRLVKAKEGKSIALVRAIYRLLNRRHKDGAL